MGFLRVCLEVDRNGEGVGIKLFCLKLIKIMLQTSNLAHKYTHILSQKMYILVTRPS